MNNAAKGRRYIECESLFSNKIKDIRRVVNRRGCLVMAARELVDAHLLSDSNIDTINKF